MNVVFCYVQKKMADERKQADREKASCEKELNEFSDMTLEQKTPAVMGRKNFEILAQVNGKKDF